METVTVHEAASILCVSRQRVHALIKSGELIAHQSGNIWLITNLKDFLVERARNERSMPEEI